MKVKISYTVDLDDVPDTLEDLMSAVKQNLSDCAAKLKFNHNNFEKMVSDHEDILVKLDLASSQVQDVLYIASGWQRANQDVELNNNTQAVEENDEQSN